MTAPWRAAILVLSMLLAGIGAGLCNEALAESPAAGIESQIDEELRCELLHLSNVDQQVRMAAIAAGKSGLSGTSLLRLAFDLAAVDLPNTARMRKIIDRYGWPGRSLVGDDGAHAAWLLVQHATHDVKFMERCAELMSEAAEHGEASPRDLAYLVDRVRMRQGKPQLYGTQFTMVGPDEHLVAEPIEDEANVDQRRRDVGLNSMAEQWQALRKLYGRR
jgi:hypothetical protein